MAKQRWFLRLLVVLLLTGPLLLFAQRETYPVERLDPGELRDTGWLALESNSDVPSCQGVEPETLESGSPGIAGDPSLVNGGDLLMLKRSWCAVRHVQISVVHYPTDLQAWRRMRAWRDAEGAYDLPKQPGSRFNDVKLEYSGSSSFDGRTWSRCSARLRLMNYLVDYRLDVADDPKGCEQPARRDVESMMKAMDALVARRLG